MLWEGVNVAVMATVGAGEVEVVVRGGDAAGGLAETRDGVAWVGENGNSCQTMFLMLRCCMEDENRSSDAPHMPHVWVVVVVVMDMMCYESKKRLWSKQCGCM